MNHAIHHYSDSVVVTWYELYRSDLKLIWEIARKSGSNWGSVQIYIWQEVV